MVECRDQMIKHTKEITQNLINCYSKEIVSLINRTLFDQ